MAHPSAVIFGCAGQSLSDAERDFFTAVQPLGFILFARNIDTPDQVRALTASLRDCVDHEAPILIDQEGGRVQRLRAPHWREAPPARTLGKLYQKDAVAGARALYLNYRLIAAELSDLGVDCDCVPCLDVPVRGAHDIIGDRAFGTDPALVAECGRIAWQGLAEGSVLPIGKHIPGHGRATADSHKSLPRVKTRLNRLEETDFVPFRSLADIPMAMTAHIVFDALDKERPVTQSPQAVHYLREELGFDGLLMSDDLSMKALGGDFTERASACFAAGCDVVLHCNGDMEEMQAVRLAVPELTGPALRRWSKAAAHRMTPMPFDSVAGLAELNDLL